MFAGNEQKLVYNYVIEYCSLAPKLAVCFSWIPKIYLLAGLVSFPGTALIVPATEKATWWFLPWCKTFAHSFSPLPMIPGRPKATQPPRVV